MFVDCLISRSALAMAAVTAKAQEVKARTGL